MNAIQTQIIKILANKVQHVETIYYTEKERENSAGGIKHLLVTLTNDKSFHLYSTGIVSESVDKLLRQ